MIDFNTPPILLGAAVAVYIGRDAWKRGLKHPTALIAALITVSIIFSLCYGYKVGCRRGQIDALNGIVKFEKVTNSDGETTWQPKGE